VFRSSSFEINSTYVPVLFHPARKSFKSLLHKDFLSETNLKGSSLLTRRTLIIIHQQHFNRTMRAFPAAFFVRGECISGENKKNSGKKQSEG
jgi:hypothetical protein